MTWHDFISGAGGQRPMTAEDPDAGAFLPSLTQLRAFHEAASLASISRASEELRRSQSAVTQAIQRLEEDLGEPLFVRTSTGSYLTEAGQILFQRASNCFSRIETSILALRDDLGQADPQLAAVARRVTRSQIRALTAVHEYGSFAQAARHAQVSLTSLQRSARTLEKQLGRQLFNSTAFGIKTNKTGGKLAAELLLAMRELDWAAEEVRSRKGALRGTLLVGSLLLAGNPFVAIGLDRFVEDHPEARIRLIHGSYDELLAKLQGGSIDFLVGLLKNPPPVDDVVEEALASDPYVIVARRSHPLASKAKVTVDDLRAGEWIAPRPTAQRRSTFGTMFGDGEMPRYSIETHSLLTILVMLASRDRLALMTRSELAIDRRLGNVLVAIDFPLDEPPAQIGVTMRRDWEATRLQRTFLDFLRSSRIDD